MTQPVGTELACVALALLCSAVLLLGMNILSLKREMAADRRAEQIIEQLYKTNNHLLGIEVAVRGYALFGNPRLMGRYREEAAKLAQALSELDRLASDTPGRVAYVQRIRDAVGVRIRVVAMAMQVAPNPPIAVVIAMHNAKSPGTIDMARNAILAMRSDEERRREALAAQTEQAAVDNFLLAGGIVIVSVLAGVIGLSLALFGRGGDKIEPAADGGAA